MDYENKANQCTDMTSIRTEIDRIDKEVILLLGERYAYVKAASKFKKTPDQVKAKSRFEAMLKTRRSWAEEQGLSADLIENIYRDLVNWFITEEMKHWSESQTDDTSQR